MASQSKAGKRGKGAEASTEGKKAKIYGGEMWRAVQGWGEGEGAVVIMGHKRRLGIDKMELWQFEVQNKLQPAIEVAMEIAQKVQEGEDEISFLEKVNGTAEEYNNQPVVISQFTTTADITEELYTIIAKCLCVSSTIKVASDRWMEDSEEISVERKKKFLKMKSGDRGPGGVPDTQPQADSESAESIRRNQQMIVATRQRNGSLQELLLAG